MRNLSFAVLMLGVVALSSPADAQEKELSPKEVYAFLKFAKDGGCADNDNPTVPVGTNGGLMDVDLDKVDLKKCAYDLGFVFDWPWIVTVNPKGE